MKKFSLSLALLILLFTNIEAKIVDCPPLELTCFLSKEDKLTGSQEEISLIQNFPLLDYEIYRVKDLGSFYLDKAPDCIKDILKSGKIWEDKTKKLLESIIPPQTNVIDIGAHIGAHTLKMSQLVGSQGCVYAFEPNMKIYRECVMNMRLNECRNVILYRAALGDKEQVIELSSPEEGNEGGCGMGQGGDYALMVTLDQLNLNHIAFMKIDVENTEDQVLQGARETIARNRPLILLEIMGNYSLPADVRKERAKQTIRTLSAMNYRVQHFHLNDYIAIPLK